MMSDDAFRVEEYGERESQPGQSHSRVSNQIGSYRKEEDCDQEFPDNVAYALGLKGVNKFHQAADKDQPSDHDSASDRAGYR